MREEKRKREEDKESEEILYWKSGYERNKEIVQKLFFSIKACRQLCPMQGDYNLHPLPRADFIRQKRALEAKGFRKRKFRE